MNRFRFSIRHSRLLWKLAASHLFITLAVVIVYVLVDVELEYRSFLSQLHAGAIAARMEREASRFAPLASRDAPNLPAMEHLLFRLKHELENRSAGLGSSYYFSLNEFHSDLLSLSLLDRQWHELLRTGTEAGYVGRVPSPIPVAAKSLILRDEPEEKMIAVPLPDENGEAQGLLLVRLQLPRRWWHGVPLSNILGELRSIDLLFMALMSLTFGYVIARHLTRRLERISTAAEAWGRGDFAVVSQDGSADEIGELSRRLNRMAEELREVIALRQNLAASEERNRLARDLHDTVKQRAFALSMQIGAAQALVECDQPAAQQRLAEAEKSAHRIRQELVAILEELRPESFLRRQKGLLAELRETLDDWSRQSGIPAALRAENIPVLPPRIQAELLRIAQEALANIVRHSRAANAVVQLQRLDQNGRVLLAIQDDGRGFDPARIDGGMGLRNMRERAESLPAGSFALASSDKTGTRIEVQCETHEVKES